MFKVFQVLFIALFAVGIVFRFRKRRQHKMIVVLGLTACLILSGLVANAIIQHVPLPTDEVVVTATGERNPQASANEVSIKGYLVGGREYPLKKPTEGKWFWEGEEYKWRHEGDSRQPDGTTRSITLNIPYGRDRSVQFYASIWNGVVEVTYHSVSERYDLFPANGETIVNVPVEDTESAALYSAKLLRLALFSAIVLLSMAFPCWIVNRFNDELIQRAFLVHKSRLVYLILAICCFIVMAGNSGRVSFWGDEIWTLGWFYLGYPGPKSVFLFLYDLWFSLMPYGQEYLLLISEFFAAASVYIAGLAGELYKGKRFGVIMAALFTASFPVMVQGGSELRPYSLLFFCTAGLLYLYLKKQKEQCKKKATMIAYVAFLVLTMDTHYFGFVLAGLLMISDFMLVALKKVKLTGLAEFIVPGIYALHWLFNLNTDAMNTYGNGWAAMPSFRGVIAILRYLCNNNNFLLSLLGIGVVITVVCLLDRSKWNDFEFWNRYGLLTLLIVPISLISLTFLYSRLFEGASVFEGRYFTVLLPSIMLFAAIAIDAMIELIAGEKRSDLNRAAVCTLSCVVILCVSSWDALPNVYAYGGENYRGSAEYLMSQNDIYAPSTICLVYGNEYQDAGFEYYLSQNGKRDSINHVSAWNNKPANLFEYQIIYCIYHHADPPDPAEFLEHGYVEAHKNESLAVIKYVKG